jgi:hypothetical protein
MNVTLGKELRVRVRVRMCGGEPSSRESRNCFDRIAKNPMELAFELEI